MGKKLRKIIVVVVTAFALMSWSGIGSADSGTVKILGDEHFVPNAMIMATFRFAPGPLSADSGATVTWDNTGNQASADEPHTVTLVKKEQVPTSVAEVFGCGAPGTVCGDALAAHLAGAFPEPAGGCPSGTVAVQPPGAPFNFCAKQKVEATGSQPGFDRPGDSLLVGAHGTAEQTISAPSGSTLYYICSFHPWMQGRITVR